MHQYGIGLPYTEPTGLPGIIGGGGDARMEAGKGSIIMGDGARPIVGPPTSCISIGEGALARVIPCTECALDGAAELAADGARGGRMSLGRMVTSLLSILAGPGVGCRL